MTDVDELTQRLTAHADIFEGDEGQLMREAADALQRMRDALEPCAKEADRMDLLAEITGGLRANWKDDKDYQRYSAARRVLRGEGT